MSNQDMTGDFINSIMEEIKMDIDKLYETTYTDRWNVLYHLSERVSMLENYLHIIESTNTLPSQINIEEQSVQGGQLKQERQLWQEEQPSTGVQMEQEKILEQAGILEQTELFMQENDTLITLTEEELTNFDGKNGKPAYVAINNTVYDVSNVGVWAAASHFGLHAGKNLTKDYMTCHAGTNSISKLPIVGKLI